MTTERLDAIERDLARFLPGQLRDYAEELIAALRPLLIQSQEPMQQWIAMIGQMQAEHEELMTAHNRLSDDVSELREHFGLAPN